MQSQATLNVLQLLVGFTVGGAEKLVLQLAPLMRERGFRTVVVCLKGPGVVGDLLQAQGFVARALGETRRTLGARFFDLFRLLRRERIQILHSHLFAANVVGRVVGKLAGVPVILSAVHGTDDWMRPRHLLADRATAIFADRITTCSRAVLEYTAGKTGIPPARFVPVFNGVPLRGFQPPVDREEKRRTLGLTEGAVVCAAGRLDEPGKGFRYFLESAALLLGKGMRVDFCLAGDGPSRGSLEALARRLGLGERFKFLGERLDIPDIFAVADVVVVPSVSEGFGLTVVEAMAARKPVVASRVGGIPEIVEDGMNGILVPPGDSHALAAGIRRLLEDRALAETLARQGYATASERFPIERMADRLAVLYREVYTRKAGGL
jgi:glycosyltransferase involved in cell wall biosynthesis